MHQQGDRSDVSP